MKKLLYIALITFVTSLSITSCTEEEVKPTSTMNGGGNGVDPK